MAFAGPQGLKFFEVCSKLGARARKRGELGPDGQPIWSIEEWEAFCRACRAFGGWLPERLGNAALCTMQEVEECIKDGYDASDIHKILAGYAPAEAVA